MGRYTVKKSEPKQTIQVIDNETGFVVNEWTYARFKGQGVTQSRRLKNAYESANNYVKQIENKQSLAGDSATYDPLTGLYTTPDGTSYSSIEKLEEGLDELKADEDLTEAKKESQESLSELKGLITASGIQKKKMAENIGARQQGQLLGQLQRAVLGTGGDEAALNPVVTNIQEASERSLQDRLLNIEAATTDSLTQVPRLNLQNITDMATLGQRQQSISDAMTQFLIDDERQKATLQAQIDAEPEWWENVLGGAGQAAGQAGGAYAASLIASDMKVKENISEVGKLHNGLPVYIYNYIGDNTPQIGVMAQDVEKVNKDAVVTVDGIKHVFYRKAVQ